MAITENNKKLWFPLPHQQFQHHWAVLDPTYEIKAAMTPNDIKLTVFKENREIVIQYDSIECKLFLVEITNIVNLDFL